MKIYKEDELTKAYYSIGELTKMFGVNASLIRFWHKEFDFILHPKINDNGKRLFRPKDVVVFSKIYHLVKVKGFTLEGAKKSLTDRHFEYQDVTPKVESREDLADVTLKKSIIEKLERIKSQLNNL